MGQVQEQLLVDWFNLNGQTQGDDAKLAVFFDDTEDKYRAEEQVDGTLDM